MTYFDHCTTLSRYPNRWISLLAGQVVGGWVQAKPKSMLGLLWLKLELMFTLSLAIKITLVIRWRLLTWEWVMSLMDKMPSWPAQQGHLPSQLLSVSHRNLGRLPTLARLVLLSIFHQKICYPGCWYLVTRCHPVLIIYYQGCWYLVTRCHPVLIFCYPGCWYLVTRCHPVLSGVWSGALPWWQYSINL